MTIYETQNIVHAPPEQVWQVLADVERWPEWLPTVTRVEKLAPRRDGEAARYRVAQPKLQPAEWQVTDWTPPVNFTWVSKSPGVQATADHELHEIGDGQTRVTLRLTFRGPMAWLVRWLYGNLCQDYLEQEVNALQQTVERARH